MKTRIEYYIRARTNGWLRGPFSSLAVDHQADKLAELTKGRVDIERHTTTIRSEVLRTVSAGDYGKED